jgi:DNA modification methylase
MLGLATIPAVRLEHLTPEQKRAYTLADNKIALNSAYDAEILAAELKELASLDLSFDLEITGFETAEIDLLVDGQAHADPADEAPEVVAAAVSRSGDHWLLDEHRLLCGDSLRGRSYSELMGTEKAQTVFADCPFNVRIGGHVGGLGAIKHREFAMASGEMSETEFIKFLNTSFNHMASVSVDGAIHFICMDWRHIGEVLAASKGVYAEFKNLCVWAKDNGGMGSLYRSRHELVFVFKVGTAPHINTIELGRNGRYRTNVWEYAGVNTMRRGRQEELAMHPTVKPVALVVDAIKDCSRRGDIVLDPFSGSGTTIIAAEKSGRRARAIEIDPLYVDVAIRRWQKLSKKQAVMDVTGETFDEIAAERLGGRSSEPADLDNEQ